MIAQGNRQRPFLYRETSDVADRADPLGYIKTDTPQAHVFMEAPRVYGSYTHVTFFDSDESGGARQAAFFPIILRYLAGYR
jgi:hypothetical protein